MPRRSAAAGVPKSQLADEDEDDNDDEMEDAEPVRKAKPTKKVRSPSPLPPSHLERRTDVFPFAASHHR